MDRTGYGSTAAIIGQVTDPNQLIQMLHNPTYAGFTNVIIARLQEINHMRQASQANVPQPPTVAQQAIAGAPEQPQQTMSRGGIVAFRHGGKVKGYKKGGKTDDNTYDLPALYGPSGARAPDLSNAPGQPEPLKPPVFMGSTTGIGSLQPPPTGFTGPPASAPAVQPQIPTPQDAAAGLRSSDAGGTSGSFSMSGGLPNAGITAPTVDRSTAPEYAQEFQDYMGPNTELESARTQMEALRASRQQQEAMSPGMAIMRAGLGMASDASTNPHAGLLGNLASGATSGLGQWTAERESLSKAQENELQRQVQLAGIMRQERGEEFKYGALQARTDAQDQRAVDVANMQGQYGLAHAMIMAKAQHDMTKLPQLQWQAAKAQAQNDYSRAYQAWKTDPTGKTPAPEPITTYRNKAWADINGAGGAVQAAGIRAAGVNQGQYLNDKKTFYTQNPPTAYFPTYDEWQQQMQGGGAAPTTIRP